VTPSAIAARWAVVLASVLVMQIGVASQVRPLGIVPDLMVVISVCAGLAGGSQRGAVVGFWAGFLYDLPRDHPLGLSALAYCLVAFAAGMLQEVVLQTGRAVSTVLVAVGSAAAVLLFAALGEMFGAHTIERTNLVLLLVVVALVAALMSRIGLRLASWADGPESRSMAE
jgi:rod shape-determining protein MreD